MSESRSEFEAVQDDEIWAAFCDMKKDGQKIRLEDVLAFGDRCWQASRRAALEEAIGTLDEFEPSMADEGVSYYLRQIEMAIRSLAQTKALEG